MHVRTAVRLVAALGLGAVLAVGVARASAGSLDPSFGIAGQVRTVVGVYGSLVSALRVQPDGKIAGFGSADYVVGETGFTLLRYTQTGALDTSFSDDGIVITPITGSTFAGALDGEVLANGSILAVGLGDHFAGDGWRYVLARYLPDGSLDSSFGTGGIVTTKVGGPGLEGARRLLVQSDNRYMVVGNASLASGTPNHLAVALVRYLSNGDLDPSFGGGDGKVVTPHSDLVLPFPTGAALDSSGRIVLAVQATTGSAFAVYRFLADGSLDGSFGVGGIATVPMPTTANTRPRGLVIQPDGKIVIGGEIAANASNGTGLLLSRLHDDGTTDTSFGVNGTVVTPIGRRTTWGPRLAQLLRQPDGKLIGAGTSGPFGSQVFAIARYTESGTLDTSFGNGGIVQNGFSGAEAVLNAGALDADGRLVAGGWFRLPGPPNNEVALARYILQP